jgi:hypothetical protein
MTILTNKNHYCVTNCTKYVIFHLYSGLNQCRQFLAKKNKPVNRFLKPYLLSIWNWTSLNIYQYFITLSKNTTKSKKQRMSSLFARPSSQRRFCCGISGISEPVFFKTGLAVNKEVYISKCLPILHKFIQKHHKKSCSGLIWRLHITQIIRWPD